MEDYQGSYTDAIASDPALRRLPYDQMARAVFARSIYYGDAYMDAFERAGITAIQSIPACEPLQFRWAADNGVRRPADVFSRWPMRAIWTRRGRELPRVSALRRIATEQIRRARPDVLWVFSGVPLFREDIIEWRRYAGSTVLWWSCALVDSTPYEQFDLILSSIKPLVREFRARGLHAESMAHAFDSRVLSRVRPEVDRKQRIAFVGNLTQDHSERAVFLDSLSRKIGVDFFGDGIGHLPSDSPLRIKARGPVWGDDLYRVYGTYALVVHKNIDVAGTATSAKRLFEAAGMGACVLTEDSDDLSTHFQRGTEVITYITVEDCAAKAERLLQDPIRARAIGQAARDRVLADHGYGARVGQFLALTSALGRPHGGGLVVF